MAKCTWEDFHFARFSHSIVKSFELHSLIFIIRICIGMHGICDVINLFSIWRANPQFTPQLTYVIFSSSDPNYFPFSSASTKELLKASVPLPVNCSVGTFYRLIFQNTAHDF
jgi:hypothetical protein